MAQQRVRSAAYFEEIGETRGGEVDIGVRGVFGLAGESMRMRGRDGEWKSWVVPLWVELLLNGLYSCEGL